MDARSEQVTRLIEAERSQIAHEIHDGLLPLLFAASATISSAIAKGEIDVGTETREKLDQASGWLTDAMHAGRQLLTEVYPPELQGRPWTRAAKDTLERLFPEDHQVICWQVDPDVNEISEAIAFAAYRIVVEAVRNAVGHGRASEVNVEGRRDGDRFHLIVRDNGNGFDPSRVADDRFGIRAMYGRAELVGGSLAIHSELGGPTTVRFDAEIASIRT